MKEITIEEAEALLGKAEAVARKQQDAVDQTFNQWQIEVEKMLPLRVAASEACSRLARALKSDTAPKGQKEVQ